MSLGEKILELRKKKGLSQEQLGEKIDVTRQTISNWELGETTPNPEQLKLLSKTLSISIDELLGNDIQNAIIEKVSNTERLAGLILKLIKIVLIGIPLLFVLLIVCSIIFKAIRNSRDTGREIEETIYCQIYGEEHSYSITYQEYTGFPIGQGGDSYFDDILNLGKYDDAHQIFNIINDYVKKNGGTCKKIESRDLNNMVDIQIKKDSLTKTGATVIINEEKDYDINYGETFWIEKYNSEIRDFEKIDMLGNNCAFTMPAYRAKPGKPLELKQDWQCMYGELSNGYYRLVKEVFFESDVPVDESDMYYIWVEFEIK